MTPRSPAGRVDPKDPVLLYDGDCGLCSGAVRFILRRDRRKTMRFAALGSAWARRALRPHPELRGIDSLVLLEGGSDGGLTAARVRSAAVLRVAAYLGGPWRILLALYLVPRPLRDYLYDVVARNRRRLFRPGDTCLIVPVGERSRFLDAA